MSESENKSQVVKSKVKLQFYLSPTHERMLSWFVEKGHYGASPNACAAALLERALENFDQIGVPKFPTFIELTAADREQIRRAESETNNSP